SSWELFYEGPPSSSSTWAPIISRSRKTGGRTLSRGVLLARMADMARIFLAFMAAATVITPPSNKSSPADDVKMGQEAAAQVERQMPIMADDAVTSYVETVGRRLVDAIPPNLQHAEFTYTFKVVNVREINAFALPGGPMF